MSGCAQCVKSHTKDTLLRLLVAYGDDERGRAAWSIPPAPPPRPAGTPPDRRPRLFEAGRAVSRHAVRRIDAEIARRVNDVLSKLRFVGKLSNARDRHDFSQSQLLWSRSFIPWSTTAAPARRSPAPDGAGRRTSGGPAFRTRISTSSTQRESGSRPEAATRAWSRTPRQGDVDTAPLPSKGQGTSLPGLLL